MSTGGSDLESKTVDSLRELADWSKHYTPPASSAEWTDDPSSSTLASLLEIADRGRYGHARHGLPWTRGQKLEITGWGGVFDRSRRRVTIAAGPMTSSVTTHRSVDIAGDDTLVCDQDLAITVGAPPTDDESDTETTPNEALADVAWGNDTVRVNGDMHWKYHDRSMTIHGTVNRVWLGGITRIVGMEGIICAGAFARTLAGASVTLAALAAGDVYGGCARTSAARTAVAGFGYRSMDSGNWASGAYTRTTSITLVPVASSPNAIQKSLKSKAAKVGLAVCPHFEIVAGVLGLAAAPFQILWGLIQKARGVEKKPPAIAPRMLTRTVGTASAVTTSEVHT